MPARVCMKFTKNVLVGMFFFKLMTIFAAISKDIVIEGTEDNFDEIVLNFSEKPVVLDFFATWCPPCKRAKPLFHSLAEEYSHRYRFVEIDIEKCPNIAKKYGIISIPSLLVLNNGTVYDKLDPLDLQSQESFIKKMTDILGNDSKGIIAETFSGD